MKIMVIGGGGREHAIIKKLNENPKITELYALPGNGGIAQDAICVPIGAKEIDKIVEFAKEKKIEFAVVAPDDPLVMGAVDRLQEVGIPCFGPDAKAALIEGSKVFSKNLMKTYEIPTAAYEVFDEPKKAISYLETQVDFPIVVKADGLALGKGVLIAQSLEEAKAAVHQIMEEKAFGESGNQIVIEEFLTGPEVSILTFTDGKTIVPMISSMDHKRALDGDEGLNTGGMGVIAPNPFYTEEISKVCMEQIFIPTIEAMKKEGRTFKGCLYFGLMLTEKGPKVIEYNCRFGDPETQAILPLLQTDLFTIMKAVEAEKLAELPIEFSQKASCCITVASEGYPASYKTGYPITFGTLASKPNYVLFHAGTKKQDGKLITAGGRVFGLTGIGNNLVEAMVTAYDAVGEISFTDSYYRKDIGQKGLNALFSFKEEQKQH